MRITTSDVAQPSKSVLTAKRYVHDVEIMIDEYKGKRGALKRNCQLWLRKSVFQDLIRGLFLSTHHLFHHGAHIFDRFSLLTPYRHDAVRCRSRSIRRIVVRHICIRHCHVLDPWSGSGLQILLKMSTREGFSMPSLVQLLPRVTLMPV